MQPKVGDLCVRDFGTNHSFQISRVKLLLCLGRYAKHEGIMAYFEPNNDGRVGTIDNPWFLYDEVVRVISSVEV